MPTRTPISIQTPSSISSSSTSTDPIKKRSLREINETGTPNSFSLSALFSQIDDPLTFEEVVKEEVWARAINEKIECIRRTKHGSW